MLKLSRNELHEMKIHAEHVSSYMATSNKRINALVQTLKIAQTEAFSYAHHVSETATHLMSTLATLSAYTTKAGDNLRALEMKYFNMLPAVEALVSRKLPAYLFPVSKISDIIYVVTLALYQRVGNTLRIAQKNPQYYLTSGHFTFVRTTRNAIAVTIEIPLT